ncbi:MAG: TRAP transporter small permease [Akkermansiaceae bacterium]|jgi:TRAP-type C4-dicarboxylate transport system permease small subunit|nr:TRAP transporter small permease [Akkermansiaceae bacterium]
MKGFLSRINQYASEISGWLLIAIIVLLMTDFIGRAVSRPVHGVSELAVFTMVAVVYLGIAHTEKKRGHVRVTAVISRLPHRLQRAFNRVVYLTACAATAVVVWAVAVNAVIAYTSDEAVAGTVPMPVWPVKLVVFVGCCLYLVQLVVNTIEEFRN